MEEGEKKELVLPPDKGYGYRKPSLVRKFSKKDINPKLLNLGETIRIRNHEKKRTMKGKIINLSKDTITVDFNNPLCDKITTFEIKLAGIKKQN